MCASKSISAIHHGGIVVSDMDRSFTFYRDQLGFKVILDETLSGKEVSTTVGLENIQLRIAMLQVGQGETVVELLQYLSPPSKPIPSNAKSNDIGVGHIAFAVSNINQVYEELSRKGVRFESPPQPQPNKKWICAYLHDPDGATLEFMQAME